MVSKLARMHYDKEIVDDLSAALLRYPETEFISPTRSTLPLLALLKDAHSNLESLLVGLGMNANSNLHLEYTVKPPKGRGKPSHTDLMVRWQTDTLALEAEWTEPRYPTVAEWANKGRVLDNRERIMRGWLDLLQPHSSRVLNLNDFSAAVYQMVHRAASACYMAKQPRLAYLHFIPDPSGLSATSEQYLSDLKHLKDLMGHPKGFSFYLIDVEIKPTAAFEQIRDLPRDTPETASAVRAALQNGPLFEFSDPHLNTINEAPYT